MSYHHARRRHRSKMYSPQLDTSDPNLHYFVLVLLVFLILCALNLICHTEETIILEEEAPLVVQTGDPAAFFGSIAPAAEKYAPNYGLYPSVLMAQAALESHYGQSTLSSDYNNYFGIKAHGNYRSVHLKTKEVYDGVETTITDSFAVYQNAYECFRDYAELLSSSETFHDVVGAASPQLAARAIQSAGYATDPDYASKLIALIEEYDLTQYDPMTRPTLDEDAAFVEEDTDSALTESTEE